MMPTVIWRKTFNPSREFRTDRSSMPKTSVNERLMDWLTNFISFIMPKAMIIIQPNFIRMPPKTGFGNTSRITNTYLPKPMRKTSLRKIGFDPERHSVHFHASTEIALSSDSCAGLGINVKKSSPVASSTASTVTAKFWRDS